MKKILLALILIGIIGTYACKKKHDKPPHIVGRYMFEKVMVRDGIINIKNATQEYNNMILMLNDQGRAELIDQNNDIHYYGVYQHDEDIDTYYLYNDDDGYYNSTDNSTLLISVSDTVRGRKFVFLGKDISRSKNKLRFTVSRADGDYRYKLKKF